MVNQFGEKLDRNGYAKSIMGEFDRCFWCGRRDRARQRHEVFHGSLYRDKSKELGLWVELCYVCHDRVHHHNAGMDRALKEEVQEKAMERFGWEVEDFRREFGKSYIITGD